MELYDPLVYKVLCYMNEHPEGVCLEDLFEKNKALEIEEVLLKYGLIESIE